MRNISAWAIKHPISPIVLFVVLVFAGIVAFVRLPVTLNPDISFPLVTVNISQPGAAPQEIETQIIQKVEGAVAGVGNIHNINSLAIEGDANIFIEFQIGTPIDRAVTDVRDAVSKVRPELPEGILEPQVRRVDVDGGAIAYYAVSSPRMTEEELSWSSTTRSPSGCWRLPVLRRSPAGAASTGRSASSWIPHACRHWASRRSK